MQEIKTYKFVIKGRLTSLNEFIKANNRSRYASNELKQSNEFKISNAIREQLKGIHISKKIFVEFHWYEVNAKRDLDNISFAKKFIFDAMQRTVDFVSKQPLIAGDGQKYVQGFADYFYIDKENPRIEVIIKELEE